jgi:hypothetical protein
MYVVTTTHRNTGYRRRRRESPMDALLTFAAFFVGLIALGLAAALWGVDSRDTIGDDHAR